MAGLDISGSTTILYRLLNDDVGTTMPTLGANRETVTHNSTVFEMWDVG